MSVNELMQSIRFVVDAHGKKAGVILDLDVWEKIVVLLEDLEDAEEMKKARTLREETVSWDAAKADLNLDD